MSKGKQSSGESVFELDRIRDIVKLMEEHDLTEVDLQQGDDRIKLGRGTTVSVAPAAMPMPAPVAHAAPAPAAAAPAGNVDDGTITINSPMVGTYYSKPNPEAESFIQVGQMINPDTIVCIIEAMKVFNEIPAECSGKIVEILVSDQEAVDFNKPLFRIQPNS
ncbi:acetyl-CoA carboxylase biotin carboxyl carrier protein [Rhodopirellula sp. MGV]|uniref:acetyl-CoA carboxylase biotin carboxyl carrier protein n=1 Tax=Rhodopirellula sp. MGV TaxID=2023130 RepID=UPI000B97C3E5|nr:acetyl-CoA carboxylase biotin carboxyl carrier protein [Rhodopirellula sp. MGV]OYP38194.1 acetyl-CoA carboxylase, biotin carboxyl carrier protein [Rhodopirellula sp. MGV]PNY38528.1 acetyl-CoA carboxylase biotin carboxyl carrier protein [Rhodopirellula baltica]